MRRAQKAVKVIIGSAFWSENGWEYLSILEFFFGVANECGR
jgi:hypothetical protein